jgi:lysophospholipase L1-like esterase
MTPVHNRRAQRSVMIGMTAVGCLFLAVACQSGVWMGPADATSVSVIGDSLVYQAETDLDSTEPTRLLADELVASGYRAHVSGWIGETTAAGHAQLWPMVAGEPDLDILVIALGTNDVKRSVPLEDSRAALRSWLADAGDVGCIALVGLNESAYAWQLGIFGPAYNQMLAEEAAQLPKGIFVPWAPDLDIHGYTGDVHFATNAARAQYRSTLHDAVDACAATL